MVLRVLCPVDSQNCVQIVVQTKSNYVKVFVPLDFKMYVHCPVFAKTRRSALVCVLHPLFLSRDQVEADHVNNDQLVGSYYQLFIILNHAYVEILKSFFGIIYFKILHNLFITNKISQSFRVISFKNEFTKLLEFGIKWNHSV